MSETNGQQPDNNANNELSTLKEKNDRLYSQFVDLQKQLEGYSKLGKPEEIRGRLEDYEGLRKTTAKTPEEIDRLIADKAADVERRFSDRISTDEKTIQEQTAKLQRYEVIVPTLQKASAIFRDTEIELIQMLAEKDLAFKDGQIVVKDKDGKPQASKKDPRQLMSVDEYLEGLAEKYPSTAKPKGIGTGKEASNTADAASYKGELPSKEELFNMSPSEIKAKGLTPDQLKLIVG